MIQTGFESRVKVQQIIESQIPEFILDENSKFSEFLKQYYISQEYQGSVVDIVENLDQYLKVDNLTPEVIVGSTGLSTNITSTVGVVTVTSTKGFPQKYGLLKIDDEIITYTGITTNTFTGCIRGFSGITSYHQDLNSEELVFSTSSASSHVGLSTVQNLSSLFLQEFYKKLKYTLTPGLENLNFVSDLNVGNFLKEARTLYESKGTDESFRILFNILFGETPKVIDLEQFLTKPSSASYVRREIVVAEAISGDPIKLEGQTIVKNTDSKTTASVSEVEIINRKGKTYYKLLLFVGYDEAFPTITGSFNITGSSKSVDYVSAGSSIITVDSTIGFAGVGTIYANDNKITYTSKSVNQFFGCSGIVSGIATATVVRSDDTYYGYENGDITKKVELRLTGVLSKYKTIKQNSPIDVGEQILVKNLGESIKNPSTNRSYKEIFANSWIYNTSSRYEVDNFSGSQLVLKSNIDKSSLKGGDYIDIFSRGTETLIKSNLKINSIVDNTINLNINPNLSSGNYDIRRKLKKANSSSVSLEYNNLTSDIQNVYNEDDTYIYSASNSLPSYTIGKEIFSYNASGVSDQDPDTGLYTKIVFSDKVSFITGSEVYYEPSNSPISGLERGTYYVEVLSGNKEIRIYFSKSLIGSSDYVGFGELTSGTHNFTVKSQKEKVISAQKILRKFPLSVNIGDGQSDLTEPGPVGMLINGTEILNYKSNNKIYYGPLNSIDVLSGGKGYDVINPPILTLSSGTALVQPIVSGSVEKIYVDPQQFDIDVVVSIALTGGNGKGASFEPVIQRRRREIEFDARQLSIGGGVDITNETITFLTNHGLINGEPIIYRPENNLPLGIGTFKGSDSNTGNTLKDGSIYYTKYINDSTIQLYDSLSNFNSGINTVGFTTINTSGIHKFATNAKNTLSEIKILNGGSGYTNRKLRVLPTGITTFNNTITFENHGFETGELITYNYETTAISGLSSSKQYYIIKSNNDTFKLADAGIGGTFRDNYERGKYVSFTSNGSGYQIFNYPEISLKVEYCAVGLGSTQTKGTINATPIIRGKIVGTYVYDKGSDYGSNILNFHKKPSVTIKNGKNAQFNPIILNGKIVDVAIQYSGSEYYSVPDIEVSGIGTGATLRPVIVNNKITDIIVVNSGAGYSTSNTTISVKSAGSGAIFDPQVRSLSVNNNALYNGINDTTSQSNEIIISSNNNLQYFVSGYSGIIQNEFNDTGVNHSPIIGWAYDGNPIYGAYGYEDPSKKTSSAIKKLSSGYTVSTSNIENRPSGFSEGFFVEDYKFTNSGDLDQYNGRFCITDDFPQGIYAYFATSVIDSNNNNVGSFPYFIGDRYRSKFVKENKTLNQSFDFNNSNLIRNTFPYKINEKYAGNDFIIESNEVINQITVVESVSKGSIENFEIVNSGSNYKIGDLLEFDESPTSGGGLIAQVSEINGEDIVNLQTSSISYDNAVFTWNGGEEVEVTVSPRHSLNNLDYVNISGFSSSLSSLNGFQQIGVTTYSSILINAIASSGIVTTDIYIANIPENISIGSSIAIGAETASVLNVFSNNIIRVLRGNPGYSHTATTPVYFIPNTFTINKSVNYFESSVNDLVYFNPKYSVGVGTTSGVGFSTSYNIGIQTNNIISIPTQSIYLPNHPFENNQQITFTKLSGSSAISVANTSTSTAFNLPISGNSQTVYVIKKSVDTIGIVTQIGLTTTTNGLFFINNGSDNYQYSLQSNFTQITGDIEKISSVVSVSTDHQLINGDTINLTVQPNLSVGIGTSTAVRVKRNVILDSIVINSIGISSSSIDTNTYKITIPSHGFKTGDKVVGISGAQKNNVYYIYKVDNNTIQLCETLVDALSNPPVVTDILIKSIYTFGNVGSGVDKWSGGVLANNGKIYGIPAAASSVLEIDPVGLTTSTFGNVGSGIGKWSGGVLANNGKIYGIPLHASSVLEIDPVGLTTSTFGNVGSDVYKWSGGVLANNGKIYTIPYNASSVLQIKPFNDIEEIQKINPQLNSIKNNNLVFDLTDSSLNGYDFKIFYDQDFSDEFVSTGSTTNFSVSGVGTVGVSTNASLTINYSPELPPQLFYALEKSGYISTADKEVVNYSQINFVDSFYNESYVISGVGTTTFTLSLKNSPEKNSYTQSECDTLKYTTSSTSASGGVSKIRTISSGFNYKKLPTFVSIGSTDGDGAYILAKSSQIGKINEVEILNEGFEYASDKTLRPEASIPKLLTIKNSNTISNISVSDGGKNYTYAPDLIIIDTDTNEKINSGALISNLQGNTITSVSIIDSPKGLPSKVVTLKAINNTNGVGINSVSSSSSGIVTCRLVTPANGFNVEPFAIGDKIFVEGIQKYGTDGDGLNSENYGYQFFTVSNYYGSGTSARTLEFSLSGLTTNPGIAKTAENLYGTIVNYNSYPKFEVTQIFSKFTIGETLQVYSIIGFETQDLKVVSSNESYIKVSGEYKIQKNQIIRGSQSGSIATINDVKESTGQFSVSYSSEKRLGWSNDVGKLNEDTQVIPDNDYYQNLSYSVKSSKEWDDIVSPVNSLLHTSGLKNFVDTEIINNANSGIGFTDYTVQLYDIIDENRIDTINNFDLVKDRYTYENTSKFLKFNKKRLSDYIECRTNRVLEIDDISGEFSSSDQNLNTFLKIEDIITSRQYEKYLIQITSSDYSKIQLTELIVLSDYEDVYNFERFTLNTGFTAETGYQANQLGSVYAYIDEIDQRYLRFDPADPYDTTYNVKYLNTSFLNSVTGVGTSSIGFVNLTGITSTLSVGSTAILAKEISSKLKSVHSEIHLIDNVTNQMSYIEVFVDHDGTNTNLSEFYFDTDQSEFSSNFIGSFGASINGGILTFDYTNTSNNSVTIRSKNVGFGSTAIGIGTYRFKLSNQPNDTEKTVRFDSLYTNVSAASTVISFNKDKFSSLKSTIKVGIGSTSALHQVSLVSDSSNTYTSQQPFLSIGSTLGIGTFGGEISGNLVSLKFYPDAGLSGNFEILSFNQIFYKETDFNSINTPPNLKYHNVNESLKVKKYYAINSDDINKLDFDLNYNGISIFSKVFEPSNSAVLNPSTGSFNLPHFFNTGEELIYTPKSTFDTVSATSVGIGSTLNYVGVVTDILPSKVYAIKLSSNEFKISTRKDYALAGIYVTFTSYGSGNAHELEMLKKNEKSIITIGNIIQSPISYSLINHTIDNGGLIGTASTIFGLSGISSIRLGDILKVENEYMKVVNVGLGTTYSGPISFAGTFPLVGVKRGFVGSSTTSHANSGIASIYRGSFNISGNKIYFADPPEGSLEDQLGFDLDNLPEARATFDGRVFLRSDYSSNVVYDDISESFTGIGQTYTLTVGGANTVGLGSTGGRGIVLINGIFQTPTTQNNKNNNFIIIENSGITSAVFSGIRTETGTFVSNSDVNMNQMPRGGMIVSLGSTPGLGYAPLVGASVTAILNGSGTIVNIVPTTIGIGTTVGTWGSGYRNPVSVAVTDATSGGGAIIQANVGAGGTLSFTITNGGSGYTNPTISISPPSYENLSVIGVSRLGIGTTTATGTGLLINVEVGASSTTGIGSTLFNVTNFKVVRTGYNFKRGDIVKAVGLVTAYGLSQPVSDFQLTILETFNDSFSAWQFGELDYIDSIENLKDGSRTTFPLNYNSQLLSFEIEESSSIDPNTLLIIFINGILQKPGVAYQFNGGTTFTFTEAPKVEDNVAIFFYRGSSADSSIFNITETLKPGDDVQVFSSNDYLGITTTQDQRTISGISTSDLIETKLYTLQGIDEKNYKTLSWTKQKVDKIINGELVSKARDSIESQIYPTAKIIKNINSTDTELYVDNAQFFNYENVSAGSIDFDGLIVSGSADPVSAAITAVVSAAGTIQSLSIINGGSGYTGASVDVKISAPSKIGIGIGTTASATISIVNGVLTTPITITNSGLGYTTSAPPQVIAPLPDLTYENILGITVVNGVSGNITGIGSTVGIGTDLAIAFTISNTTDLIVGQPIYIFDTRVGNSVTSIYSNNTSIVGVGTTFLDNIYVVAAFSSGTGIVTCNIHSGSYTVGIATTGSSVGKFSWGKLSGFTRSSSPVSIGVSGFTVNSGLTTFPTIQRRGYGLRGIGPIKKIL